MCCVQTAEVCTLYERHSLALLALFSFISNKIDPFFYGNDRKSGSRQPQLLKEKLSFQQNPSSCNLVN